MSDIGAPKTTSRSDLALGIAGIVLLLGVFLFFSGQSQQVLRKSPAGFDGLSYWLSSKDQRVQNFTGGWTIDAESIGLRILPLFDTRFDSDRAVPTTKEELLMQRDEYDLRGSVVRRKIARVPTLVVLPKWRSGMRLTGIGHPGLLLPPQAFKTLLKDIKPQRKVSILPKPFTDFSYESTYGAEKTARLYTAQVIEGTGCTPIIGTVEAMVLGRCAFEGAHNDEVMVLSDPDLLNNHGLRLGDNAVIMRELLLAEANVKPKAEDAEPNNLILIDYSTRVWVREANEEPYRERTWSDLLQFFAYPFSILWGSVACLMLLVFWRAGFRYGPLLPDTAGLGASKFAANTARARLMRMTGQDSAMLEDYARTRMASVAAANLGPAQAREPNAAMRFIERKRPDIAPKLKSALAGLVDLPPNLGAQAAIERVDEIERLLEQLEK